MPRCAECHITHVFIRWNLPGVTLGDLMHLSRHRRMSQLHSIGSFLEAILRVRCHQLPVGNTEVFAI